MKSLIIGCALAGLFAGAAIAQTPPPSAPPKAPTGPNGGTATLSAAGSPDAATQAAIRVGAEVKSTNGAALGHVERVIPATLSDAAQVTLRAGERRWTMPQSELTLINGTLVTNRPGGAK